MEMGVAPLIITCSDDPLATFLLPVPTFLCSAGLEVLVPQGGMLLPGDTIMSPLNWKLRPGHVVPLMPLNQQAKKRVTVLAGVIGPDYQREIVFLLHSGDKGDHVCNTGDP